MKATRAAVQGEPDRPQGERDRTAARHDPLYEYSAPKAGVTDGAIFSYLVATDPEAILLIEAFDEKGKTGFRYAFARFHFWRLTAKLNDKTVWDVELDRSMINNPIAAPDNDEEGLQQFRPVRFGVRCEPDGTNNRRTAMNCPLPTRSRWSLCGFASALAVWILCLGGLSAPGVAQEKQPEKADAKPPGVLAEFLDDAKNYTIRIVKPDTALKLHEKSVLDFTNPERKQDGSSVFVWLDEGRPAVIGRIFQYQMSGRSVKKHSLHSLVPVELEAKFGDKLAWTPDKPGIEWKAVPDVPAVAATQKERLAQLRQLAKPFKVNLTDRKEKVTELRLAPQPVYEYSAPKAGVTDGAIFTFLVGNEPQAILLVEAFDEKGKTGFRYAFARFNFQKMAAKLGDKTVWEVEYDPLMSGNKIGNPEAMKQVYNSFFP